MNDFAPTKLEIADEKKVKENLALLLRSLGENQFQSVHYLRQNTGLSVDEILHHVDFNESIGFQMCGALPVYFLEANRPNGKLYNTGSDYAIAEDKNMNTKPTKVTPPYLEQLAFEGKTRAEAADLCGVKLGSFNVYLSSKYPDNQTAWKKGQERRIKEQSPKALPKPISIPSPLERSIQTIEENHLESVNCHKVEAHLVGSNRHTEIMERVKPEKRVNPFPEPVLSVTRPLETVIFSDGSLLEFVGDINPFQMSDKERNLVNGIIDLVQEFKKG